MIRNTNIVISVNTIYIMSRILFFSITMNNYPRIVIVLVSIVASSCGKSIDIFLPLLPLQTYVDIFHLSIKS